MAIDSKIVDGTGKKHHAKVNKFKALKTYSSPPELPAIGTQNDFNFYRSEFTGMNVNGSTTPVNFTLASDPLVDIVVTHIIILIADGSVAHNKFGGIAELANGFNLKVTQEGVDTYFYQNIKTTGQMLIKSGMFFPYGDYSSAYIIPNFIGTSDGVIIRMDVKDFFPGVQGGLRIGRGTKNTIIATVRDNLTSLDDFSVTFFGHTHQDLNDTKDIT